MIHSVGSIHGTNSIGVIVAWVYVYSLWISSSYKTLHISIEIGSSGYQTPYNTPLAGQPLPRQMLVDPPITKSKSQALPDLSR